MVLSAGADIAAAHAAEADPPVQHVLPTELLSALNDRIQLPKITIVA